MDYSFRLDAGQGGYNMIEMDWKVGSRWPLSSNARTS